MTRKLRFVIPILCLTLALAMVAILISDGAEGKDIDIETDDPYDIFLWIHDDPDDIMTTQQGTPDADNQGVTQMDWIYGLDSGGEPLHGDFDLFDNIGGGSKGVVLKLTIENPQIFGGDIHVEFRLKDDGETIAEGSGDIEANGGKTVWDLEFTGPAAGMDSYIIRDESIITLEMDADSNVNVVYDNGNDEYYLRFNGNQFNSLDVQFDRIYIGEPGEEIRADNSNNNLKFFKPNEIADNAFVYINGSVVNSLGNYDVSEIEVQIYFDESPVSSSGTADLTQVVDGDIYHVAFTYAWDYADIADLNDGEYTARLILKDNFADHEYKYGESIFKMSNYGSYVNFAAGEAMEKRVSAGDYVEFEMRIYNTGLEEDTFELEHDDIDDWTVILKQGDNEVSELTVEAAPTNQEPVHTTIVLNITVPEDAGEGRILINVKASSTESGISNRISYQSAAIVVVSPKTGVESYFMDGAKKIYEWEATAEKGEDTDVEFFVSNGGTAEDTFLLQWNDKPADWNFWFVDADTDEIIEDKKVTIDSSTDLKILFRVRPAEDINSVNEADLILSARSENNTEVEATIDLTIYRSLGVVLLTDQDNDVTPASVNYLLVWVQNTGTEDKTFSLDVSVPADMSGWTIAFEDDQITVPKEDTVSSNLKITPNSGVEARPEGYTFTLLTEAEDDSDIYFELDVRVYIKAGYAFVVEPASDSKKVDSGDKVEYVFTVQNTGNAAITVNLRIDTEASKMKDSWEASLNSYVEELEPEQSASFRLTVEAPNKANNEQETTVVVSVTIQEDPTLEEQTFTATTEAESTLFNDIRYSESFWLVAGGIPITIIILFVFFKLVRRQEELMERKLMERMYPDEDQEYDDEYEDADEYEEEY